MQVCDYYCYLLITTRWHSLYPPPLPKMWTQPYFWRKKNTVLQKIVICKSCIIHFESLQPACTSAPSVVLVLFCAGYDNSWLFTGLVPFCPVFYLGCLNFYMKKMWRFPIMFPKHWWDTAFWKINCENFIIPKIREKKMASNSSLPYRHSTHSTIVSLSSFFSFSVGHTLKTIY